MEHLSRNTVLTPLLKRVVFGCANIAFIVSLLLLFTQHAFAGNQAPVAGPNLNINMGEDTTNNFILAGSDPEMDFLSAEIIAYTVAQNGSTLVDSLGNSVVVGSIIADRQLFFTPQENTFSANYALISYRVNDGTQNSANTATVTVNVTAINDLPFATLGAILVMDEDSTLNFDMGGQDIEGDVFECQILQVGDDITAGNFDWIQNGTPISVVDASGRIALQSDFGAHPWSMRFSPFFANQCNDQQFYQFSYRFNETSPIILGDSNWVSIQVRCINDEPLFSVAGFGSQNLATFNTLLLSDSAPYTLPVIGLTDVDGAAVPSNSGPNPGTQRISITSSFGSVAVNEAGFPGITFTSSTTSIEFEAVLTTVDTVLATLTYTAGVGTTTDTLTILANDGGSNQGCTNPTDGLTCPLSAGINIDISIGAGGATSGIMPLGTGSGGFITVDTILDDISIDGLCSLREAINAANTNTAVDTCVAGSGDDIILIPTGTIPISLGTLNITESLTIIGAGDSLTLIDGAGLSQVFTTGSSLSLRDLSVIGEDSDGDGIINSIDGQWLLGSFVDQANVFSNQFTDEHLGGNTFGAILDRSGHLVTVTDAGIPDGVNISASGGSGAVQISVCNSLVQLTDGQSRLLTCSYTISGNLMGLNGNQVILQNNGSDDLTLNSNGSFIFDNLIIQNGSYAVTVLSNPSSPDQTCTISNASAMNVSVNVVNVEVTCVTTKYDVNVIVTGLATGNSIDVTNGTVTETLSDIITQTSFNLDDGTSYAVSSTDATSPNQDCLVTGGINNDGSGILAGLDVEITITCTDTNGYYIGGMTTGLVNGNPVTLSLEAEELTVDGNIFVFHNPIADGSNYSITIVNEPLSPSQSCNIINSTGQIASMNIIDVEVNCQTNSFSIGGMLSGMHNGNSISLQNNNGDNLLLSSNGTFTFTNQILDLQAYVVSITTQPTAPIQNCTVTNGANSVAGETVITITVACDFGDDLIFADGFE